MTNQTPSSGKNTPTILKRAANLIAVAGVPGTALGFACDFLGPKGGWILGGVIGFFAILASIYLLISLSKVDTLESKPLWKKYWDRILGDGELDWLWTSKPPIRAHGVHICFFFGLVLLVSVGKTYADVDYGGYLGKNLDTVAAIQKQLNISTQILQEQKKIEQELKNMSAIKAKEQELIDFDSSTLGLVNLRLGQASENEPIKLVATVYINSKAARPGDIEIHATTWAGTAAGLTSNFKHHLQHVAGGDMTMFDINIPKEVSRISVCMTSPHPRLANSYTATWSYRIVRERGEVALMRDPSQPIRPSSDTTCGS